MRKPQGLISQHVTQCLAIIALYLPLVWYVLHLRGIYPQGTNLMAMETIHLVGVVSLLIGPLFIMHFLGIKWRGPSDRDESALTD